MGQSARSIEVDAALSFCRIDGVEYPAVGLGTYRSTGPACKEAVRSAIESGYRIIDTATFYKNFEGIGEALRGEDRRSFYIVSKVWHDKHSPVELRKDLEFTLNQLGLDYLDAYLLHWPNSSIPIESTLSTMEEFRREKKIRHIGLSNVSVNHLKRALEVGIPISWVQVEMHPYFCDARLLQFCREHSIVIQAWRPLDLGRILEDELLGEIGAKYGKTACQIALRWIVQHGCIPLPGSQNKRHIQENLDIRDFALSGVEMEAINRRAFAGSRFRLEKERGLGFTDEFDFTYEQCWPRSS